MEKGFRVLASALDVGRWTLSVGRFCFLPLSAFGVRCSAFGVRRSSLLLLLLLLALAPSARAISTTPDGSGYVLATTSSSIDGIDCITADDQDQEPIIEVVDKS